MKLFEGDGVGARFTLLLAMPPNTWGCRSRSISNLNESQRGGCCHAASTCRCMRRLGRGWKRHASKGGLSPLGSRQCESHSHL